MKHTYLAYYQRHWCLVFVLPFLMLVMDTAAQAASATDAQGVSEVMQVGPERTIKSIAEAAILARAGTTIEVDAGSYVGDVAVWTQEQLTLRAVGGRVRLTAASAAAEGKAIWVVRGGQILVDGFEFSGTMVAAHNGAGIRFEKGELTVRNCAFLDNENGILTSNNPDSVLTIENSEFGLNGYGDGQSHNLYVGAIKHLTVTGSYFHHARVGHLLKSRATVNDIRYNRLTDEAGGHASYELEFPNGGVAYVVGNIIAQGVRTENPHIISYGAEGYRSPENALYLVNNTLLDSRPQGGVFLRVKPGDVTVRAVNNLLVGKGMLESAGPGDYRNNLTVAWSEMENAGANEFRLKRRSRVSGKIVDAGTADGKLLMPDSEYAHPHKTIRLKGRVRNAGALQNLR